MYTNMRTKYWSFYALAALSPVIRAALTTDISGDSEITANTVSAASSGASNVIVDTEIPANSILTGTGIASNTVVSSSETVDNTYTIYVLNKPTVADGAAGAELQITTDEGDGYTTTLLKASTKGDLSIYAVGGVSSAEGETLNASIAGVTDTDTTVDTYTVYPVTDYNLGLSNPLTADVPESTTLTVPAIAPTFSIPEDSSWSIQNIAATTDTSGIFTFVLNAAANIVPNAAYINTIISMIAYSDSDYSFSPLGVNVSGHMVNIVFKFTAPEPFEVGMPLFEDKTGAQTIVKAGREVTINSATFNCNGNIV